MAPVIFYFFSKYSVACQQLTQTMKYLASFFPIQPVDIDNVHVRRKLLQSQIRTVPACVVESTTTLEIFSGVELQAFVQQLMQQAQPQPTQQQQQPFVPPPQTMLMQPPTMGGPTMGGPTTQQLPVQSIVNPALQQAPPAAKQSTNESINARLAPQQFGGAQPGTPMLTTQIATGDNIKAQAQALQQQAQQQQAMNAQPVVAHVQPQPQPVFTPMAPQQTVLSSQPPPPEQPQAAFAMIDESAALQQPNPNVYTPQQGMSMQDITGTATMSRMNNGGGGALAQAAMMQQEREAGDASMNQRSNAMMLATNMQQAR